MEGWNLLSQLTDVCPNKTTVVKVFIYESCTEL